MGYCKYLQCNKPEDECATCSKSNYDNKEECEKENWIGKQEKFKASLD